MPKLSENTVEFIEEYVIPLAGLLLAIIGIALTCRTLINLVPPKPIQDQYGDMFFRCIDKSKSDSCNTSYDKCKADIEVLEQCRSIASEMIKIGDKDASPVR